MQERITKNICTLLQLAGALPACKYASHAGVLPYVYMASPEADYRREFELALTQDAAQRTELTELTAAFAAAGIPVVALKGCVLKPIYPGGSHMRTMCDLDFLIKPEDAARVKEVMVARGYETEAFGMYHHDEYVRPPLLSVEMHRTLVPDGERAGEYYAAHDIWERVIVNEDGTCTLPLEDHYTYIVAHFAGHLLERGGSSLRGLLDLYVFRMSYPDLDDGYIHAVLTEMKLADFEDKYLRMAYDLFDGEAPQSGAWHRELEAMLACGMLGTASVRAARRREEIGGGRFKYIWRRLFPSYRHMCSIYPRLVRHKWLLPFYYIRRMICEPFRNRAALRAELRELKKKNGKKEHSEKNKANS